MTENKSWKKRVVCLASVAMLLTAGAKSGQAMAYFTTYALASGGGTLLLGVPQTEITEEVVNANKQVSIQNIGDYDCYVRLRVFAGDAYPVDYHYSQNWTQGSDGYFYYGPVLTPKDTEGAVADRFDIEIAALKEAPREDSVLPADFNIIVIQEYTPVLYDEDGNPYADWNLAEESAQVSVPEVKEGE